MNYSIHKAIHTPELSGNWDGKSWQQAETLTIDHFHPRSSDHKPEKFQPIHFNA